MNIAVVMGGYSDESVISLRSGQLILNNLDKEKYNIYEIHILLEGWHAIVEDEKFPINKADLGIEALVLDTIDYNKDFPPFSIVEQDPEVGEKVKDGRKIYVKINAGGYAMITLPDLEEKTYRQIQATFRALGLQEGEIIYKPNLAKDLVLVVKHNGKVVKKGDKILKNSVLDLELGDGKRTFEDSDLDIDTISVPKPEIDVDVPTTEGQ